MDGLIAVNSSFAGATGTLTLMNSNVSGKAHNNVHIRDTSGIPSLTVTGSMSSGLNDTTGATLLSATTWRYLPGRPLGSSSVLAIVLTV
jgi:hypothetical protein